MDAFESAAPPGNQPRRLEALRDYGILDTPAEASFEDLTRLAASICETPMSLVSLVDESRQWFKSEIGLGVRELPINSSFCAHAILQPDGLEIPDTHLDERFRDNPLVTGAPRLRFYAGTVLRTADGLAMGTICVLDTRPRRLTVAQKDALGALARQAMALLELRRALGEAAKSMRYRSQLMAVAGHDLRQPMQVLSMSLGALRKTRSEDIRMEILARAERALIHLKADLESLSETSQVEPVDEVHLESFPVAQVLAEIADTWHLHAESQGVRLRVVRSRAWTTSSPRMLRSIVGNLVGNAIKYTKHGEVLVGCRYRADRLLLEVHDSGRGIAEADVNRIFEPFTQLDARSDGLGLGLSIVKQFAGLLGHELRLTSKEGVGSRFTLVVPNSRAAT